MIKAPIPSYEVERLRAVIDLAVLDTKPEDRYDVLTQQAVDKLKVPICMISIIEKDREWFKSCVGLNRTEGERSTSFCAHTLLEETIMVVQDTRKDYRFADHPHVIGGIKIRFYAGVALYDHKSGYPVGVFCIKGYKPRKLQLDEISILVDLSKQAEFELNKPRTGL